MFRGVKEKEKRQQMGPQAPARRKEVGMYVKNGGIISGMRRFNRGGKV